MQKTMICLISWWAFAGAAMLTAAAWGTVQILGDYPESLARHEGD